MKYAVFHVDGGIGKNIVATNVVRCIKQQYPDRELVVVSPWPEVFLHNPNIYRLYKTGVCPYFYDEYIKNKDTIVFRQEPYYTDGVIRRNKCLAQAWCESMGIKFDTNQPQLFFNIIETQNSDILFKKYDNSKPIIAFQINGGLGTASENHINFNWYRDLPPRYVLPIINEFKDKFNLVQIRNNNQFDLGITRIDLTLRELLIFLSRIQGAVGIDSMLQHTMAAFNKPSIVTWIGNSSKVYGYDMHKNLNSKIDVINDSENLESYLEPYPLLTLGHQCPASYQPDKIFDETEIRNTFVSLYSNAKQA